MMDPVTPITPASVAAPAAAPAPSPKDKKTAENFEAVFIGQMMQLMMGSVEQGEFSGGHGEEMFRGVLAEQLGTVIAKRGGIGLAPAVLDQIIRLQQGNTGNAR
ncbi:MAG: rod-binding protein [Sphingomonas sp.]